ncbi:BolA family transcriptional regulator [Burkholderia sp. Leaf177]|uniref:BolA family protein n=1 Tax=Burkholderia sp. Leaf177 TaxID=1736287 RepID=UPI0006FFB29D|nr:BolA family protein [Burkholderia sp. Leaf177]KQR87134.1 BolA family transcriptional regulator [Burkholderia sp. Leaf177]
MSDPGFDPVPTDNFVNASAEGKIAHLEARLNAALNAQSVHIDDDSAAHAGHAGASAGSHYTVTIVAAGFAGKPRVARHRLVYDALADEMRRGIHALAIKAYTPEEFADQFE